MFMSIAGLCKLAIPHLVTRWRMAGVRKMYKETDEHQDKRPRSYLPCVHTEPWSAASGNALKELLWLSAIPPPPWRLPDCLNQKQSLPYSCPFVWLFSASCYGYLCSNIIFLIMLLPERAGCRLFHLKSLYMQHWGLWIRLWVNERLLRQKLW